MLPRLHACTVDHLMKIWNVFSVIVKIEIYISISLSFTHSLSGTGIKLERTHGPCTKVNSSSSDTTHNNPTSSVFNSHLNSNQSVTPLLSSIHSTAAAAGVGVVFSVQSLPPPNMGLGLTSILKATPSSWAWASCKAHPRTLSFREEACVLEEDDGDECSIAETVMQGLRSERLFFDQTGVETSSKVMETKMSSSSSSSDSSMDDSSSMPFKESVAEEMESENPFKDFRVSMEEMIVAHGLKDWDCLEELLEWYLRMNGKNTHGFILGAFVDLLLDLAFFFPPPPHNLHPPPFSYGCSTAYSSSSCFCTCSSPTTTATSSSSSAKFAAN